MGPASIVLRVVSIAIGFILAVYAIRRRQTGRFSRLDLLIAVTVAVGLVALGVFPGLSIIPAELLGVQTRWFAVLFLANVLTFILFIYVLNRANQANRQIGYLVQRMAQAEYFREASVPGHLPSLFVVIPAFNEADAIGGVLRQIPSTLLGYEVRPVVVVDGSTDGTEEVVRRESYLVAPHLVNRGQGDALRTGFAIALKEGADIVMTMDADGQHKSEDMDALVKPIVADEADFVMGSRFAGTYEDRGGMRHAGILFFTIMINVLGGVHISDCTNGFRAIRGTGLAKLRLKEDRYNAPELIMEAARQGLRIMEVPVSIASRQGGISKKGGNIRYPLGFMGTVLRVWLR